jgi:hypothetical protein
MGPLAALKKQIVVRVRRDTVNPLTDLAFGLGMKPGPFLAHVAESISECKPERFHAAMAEFRKEARRG